MKAITGVSIVPIGVGVRVVSGATVLRQCGMGASEPPAGLPGRPPDSITQSEVASVEEKFATE